MSLFGSLFSGVSGLNAQSRAMGMISDNIANVNTTAYKGASAQFANLVTRSRGSSTYSPGGVRAQSFYTVATQGLIQGSASPTDAAISGAGFFVVNAPPDGAGRAALHPRRLLPRPTSRAICARRPATTCRAGRSTPNERSSTSTRSRPSTSAASTGSPPRPPTSRSAPTSMPTRRPMPAVYAAGDLAAYQHLAARPASQPTFTRAVRSMTASAARTI